MKFSHSLRDPIHGMIPLTACEWDLLRTQAFSRLRGIRQMGMAYIVYPSAHHTRFEHVIGAMHTAWLLTSSLDVFSEQEIMLIRLAALSHDLGHRPFSHSLEDAARRYANDPGMGFLSRFLDHEERTKDLLLHDPEIGSVFANHPDYTWLDREELANLAVGEHSRPEFNLLIHSEIDADRIDYVLRDNYYCGFEHGVDVQALRDLYRADPEQGLILSAHRTYVATQLLAARYHLIANIQNSPRCRLGDLLLAECVFEALHGADTAKQEAFTAAVDNGRDSDLDFFLRQNSGRSWDRLQSLVAGQNPFTEIAFYDFSVLSPLARFGLHSLAIRGNVAEQLEKRLSKEMTGELLVDLVRVKAPTEALRFAQSGHAPWHGTLTDLPIVQGIVEASLRTLAVHVYASADDPPEIGQEQFRTWVERHSQLDPSMSHAKAEGVLHDLWGGDRLRMGLLLALETMAIELLQEQVGSHPSRLDMLFLTCYAALSTLEESLDEQRLYLDSREAVWGLLHHPTIVPAYGERLPRAYSAKEPTGRFVNDLRFLADCGLLYAPSRVERVKNVFIDRPKFGGTGWGRRLARLLRTSERSRSFTDRIREAMERVFAPSLEAYGEYFSLLRGEEGPETGSRRRELRRRMPIPITR